MYIPSQVVYQNGRRIVVQAPQVMAEPFAFDRKIAEARGKASRKVLPNGIRVTIAPPKKG
jgi:hypothetical protein